MRRENMVRDDAAEDVLGTDFVDIMNDDKLPECIVPARLSIGPNMVCVWQVVAS